MLRRLLGRTSFRAALSVAGGVAFFYFLTAHGWPWWAALPAAILFTVGFFGAMLFTLYGYIRQWHKQQRDEMWRAYRLPPGAGLDNHCTTSPAHSPQRQSPPRRGGNSA